MRIDQLIDQEISFIYISILFAIEINITKKKQYITNKNNIKYKIYKVQSNVILQQALLLVQLKILITERETKKESRGSRIYFNDFPLPAYKYYNGGDYSG